MSTQDLNDQEKQAIAQHVGNLLAQGKYKVVPLVYDPPKRKHIYFRDLDVGYDVEVVKAGMTYKVTRDGTEIAAGPTERLALEAATTALRRR